MRSSFRSNSLPGLLLALALAATPAAAAPHRIPPVDQCAKDKGFAAFRAELKGVVARRDREAFLALISPDIEVDFGGSKGRDAFARQWSFDTGEYGNLWTLLDRMLGMGCALTSGMRVIPSLIEQVDTAADQEYFDRRLVLPGALLFKEPGNRSTATRIAPWMIVTATDSGGDLWTRVRLPDGRTGLMSDDDLYEPLGYRMMIEKRDGKWKITAFVAGD